MKRIQYRTNLMKEASLFAERILKNEIACGEISKATLGLLGQIAGDFKKRLERAEMADYASYVWNSFKKLKEYHE